MTMSQRQHSAPQAGPRSLSCIRTSVSIPMPRFRRPHLVANAARPTDTRDNVDRPGPCTKMPVRQSSRQSSCLIVLCCTGTSWLYVMEMFVSALPERDECAPIVIQHESGTYSFFLLPSITKTKQNVFETSIHRITLVPRVHKTKLGHGKFSLCVPNKNGKSHTVPDLY